ncbi:MAG: YiiX/YebB-like N1pC/P60 family cysteine hydrolase [Desulfobacterales bacterium]
MKALKHLRTWLHNLAIKRLEAPLQVYEQRTYNSMDKLLEVIRKGDVVLVEGRSEISRIIKLFTNSSWSHSALYVGDELLKKDRLSKERYQMKFGADAGHLLIEAEVGKGVTIAPLSKF